MPAFAASDAQQFLRDFGVTVINGTTECLGLLDEREFDDGGVTRRRQVVRIERGTAGTVAEGDTLTVDGRMFKVHRPAIVTDALFEDFILAGADP